MVTVSQRRAVGVVRVSEVAGRAGEAFQSPDLQRKRIEQACELHQLQLTRVYDELDVSAKLPLQRRPGLREAVALVEAGQAHTVVVAYFDRLVRNLKVQAEVLERVEAAGGAILAVDVGHVRADTASHWLSSTMLGMVAEYQLRMTRERTEDIRVQSVARGIAPFAKLPAGYVKSDDRRIQVDAAIAPVIRQAFELRVSGATWRDIRRFLAEHGIERTVFAVQHMLANRMYLGELRFGERVNVDSHPPIVDRATFDRAQRPERPDVAPQGRRSDQLLSRTGILRCASCGRLMSVGASVQANGKRVAVYRCVRSQGVHDCPAPSTVKCDWLDELVSARVQQLIADERGTASLGDELDAARDVLSMRKAELKKAIRNLATVDDEDEARSILDELRTAAREAEARLVDLERIAGPTLTVSAADWPSLTLDERRALISAVIERVDVARGRGAERVTIVARRE